MSEAIMVAIINTIVTKILVLKQGDDDKQSLNPTPEDQQINRGTTTTDYEKPQPIAGSVEVSKIDEGIMKSLFLEPNAPI